MLCINGKNKADTIVIVNSLIENSYSAHHIIELLLNLID